MVLLSVVYLFSGLKEIQSFGLLVHLGSMIKHLNRAAGNVIGFAQLVRSSDPVKSFTGMVNIQPVFMTWAQMLV